MWVVVIFEKENSISVVPKCWLMKNSTVCCWPPVPNVKNWIMKCKEPQGNWQIFGVRLLGGGKVYDNYLKARAAARRGEETSDINSDAEGPKRKRTPKRFLDEVQSETSNEDEMEEQNDDFPEFPTLPSTKPVITAQLPPSTPQSQTSSQETLSVTPSSGEDVPKSNTGVISETTVQRILRQQCVISLKLSNLQSDVNTLLQHICSKKDTFADEDFTYEQELPLKTVQEFQNFNKFIGEAENLQKLTRFVIKIGGSSPYECVKRVMSRIMTDEVANKICWHGTNTKAAFKSTQVQLGLTAGIQTILKSTSEKTIEESVRSWLRHAQSRLKSKKN